jgi:hypothetical protein
MIDSHRALRFLAAATVFAGLANADATVRYETKAKASAILPPEAKEQFEKSAAVPMTMYVKGHKGYTRSGSVTSIFDLGRHTATIIDDDKKTFASASLPEYQKAVLALTPKLSPSTHAFMEKVETYLTSRKTGRVETIGGIRAEEHEVVFITSKKATGSEKPGMLSRVVIQMWTAMPGKTSPALAELDRFSASSATAVNPSSMIEQMLSGFAGMGKNYAALNNEFNSKGLVLRTCISIYVPMMAELAKAMASKGQPIPGFDADAPLGELTQELAEIKASPVPDSVFNVPSGYRHAEIGEVLKSRFPEATK